MSEHDVLTPILLRSSTPAPSEKVLLYLEGIARSGGASPVDRDRQSIISDLGPSPLENWNAIDPKFTKLTSHHGSRAPSKAASRVASQRNQSRDLNDLAESELDYVDVGKEIRMSQGGKPGLDDAASDEQDGLRSEFNGETHHEPGPEDEPGPRYESYGSSFGNLGPPPHSIFGPPQQQTQPGLLFTPSRAVNVPLPAGSDWMSPRSATKSFGGSRPGGFASMMSPRTTDVNIDVEPPSEPSRVPSHMSRAPSRQSHRSSGTSKKDDIKSPSESQPQAQVPQGITITVDASGTTTINVPPPASPIKAPSPSKPPTEKLESESPEIVGRSFSPQSAKGRSERPSASVAGSRFPPLPSSKGDDSEPSSILSPTSRYQPFAFGATKAPSKAPSKAASAKSPLNGDPFASWTFGDMSAPVPAKVRSRKASTHEPSVRGPSRQGDRVETVDSATSDSASKPDETSLLGLEGMHDQPRSIAGSARNGAPSQKAPSFFGGSQRAPSKAPSASRHSRMPSGSSEARSNRSGAFSPAAHSHNGRVPSRMSALKSRDEGDATPTHSRALSPSNDNDDYESIVQKVLSNARTPRTSIAPSMLDADIKASHFHDQDLCILLHAAEDETQHDVVKKAVRKALQARMKKLKLKYDNESVKAYTKSFHDHDPSWHEHNSNPGFNVEDPPAWAKAMMKQLEAMEMQMSRIRSSDGTRTRSHSHTHTRGGRSSRPGDIPSEADDFDRTPRMRSAALGTQATGDESMFRPPGTDYTNINPESMGVPTTLPGSIHHYDGSTHGTGRDEFEDEEDTHRPNGHTYTDHTPTRDGDPRSRLRDLAYGRNDSPGQQVLEEELYRLRVKDGGSQMDDKTHQSWEIAREMTGDRDTRAGESEMPEIMDTNANEFDEEDRPESPPLPPIPTGDSREVVGTHSQAPWATDTYQDGPPTPPWQRIHQRLLNWAIVWPMSELDTALNSTLAGFQVDEVALSIWSTQMYKRYVRQQLTEVPPGRVDRLFVPPNMADAINNAVFHGRHGDACGMLRDLWTPFALEGMPRIIVVLCKHRSDPSHWVAHKFSLPDGTLTTYDTYPEKCLPDGRPLGWWFAIRIAWAGAMYPSPDHLMQKMVRLHRPMQLNIDNSVAAAGIWRNLLMGSRAERPVDLARLRDLVNTEVKNLRQRKEQGKLSVAATRSNWNWEEMA